MDDVVIPSSLRSIQPFLEDGRKFARFCLKNRAGPSAYKYAKIAVSCLNHGFKLNAMLNAELSAEDRHCLEEFYALRLSLYREIGGKNEDELPPYRSSHGEEVGTHELLIAEADAVLRLADEQAEQGLKTEAMLNYHTACVFFRVMETMVPSKASASHHDRLVYAADRLRLSSTLYQNFVRENFTGGSCSEVYEVHGTNKLGKGSYGSVYLATHRVTSDERAVKVMNVDRITSYYLRKLHTEIAILKSLDHPNIVKLQDVFFGKRSVYIVTDLCRGGELFELLNSGKNQGFVFREDRASKLMRDMLSAVNYLHEHGIVHRDLKLENFLFEDHNANSPLILIDFGLSKHFVEEERLTQKVGSCYYTAPEVLNGNYDARCDVWSLGVLCYMLLSGSPPFYGKTVEDVYSAILSKDASFADKKFKHVSNACMDFMKRLLVRDPRYRLTTKEALLHPFITGASYFPRYTTTPSTTSSSLTTRSLGEMDVEASAQLSPQQANQILESMISFGRCDTLTKLALNIVSHSLGYGELQRFREEFQAIDCTFLGGITRKDFIAAFSSCDTAVQQSVDLRALFESLSIERKFGFAQELSYHEYVAASMLHRVTVNDSRLDLVFNYIDTNSDGRFDAHDLQLAMGGEISQSDTQAMIRAADTDHDGFVTKNDFLALWRRANSGDAFGGESKSHHK